MSLSDLASLLLSSETPTAPIRLSRARAQLDLAAWPVAYFEAVQGLDDNVEGLTEPLRRELVVACGRAAGGAGVWDLAVVHYQEASTLPQPSPLSPDVVSKDELTRLLTTSLQNLQRLAQHPRLLQKLGEKKATFLEEAFPGLSSEDESGSDAEWESDDGSEEGGEEAEAEESGEAAHGADEDDAKMS